MWLGDWGISTAQLVSLPSVFPSRIHLSYPLFLSNAALIMLSPCFKYLCVHTHVHAHTHPPRAYRSKILSRAHRILLDWTLVFISHCPEPWFQPSVWSRYSCTMNIPPPTWLPDEILLFLQAPTPMSFVKSSLTTPPLHSQSLLSLGFYSTWFILTVPDLRWFNLQFFYFMMVWMWYTTCRNILQFLNFYLFPG